MFVSFTYELQTWPQVSGRYCSTSIPLALKQLPREREREKLIDKRINKCTATTFTVNTKQGSRRSNNNIYSPQYASTHRHCKRLFKVVVWHQVILKILWKASLNMATAAIIPYKTHGWFNIRSYHRRSSRKMTLT